MADNNSSKDAGNEDAFSPEDANFDPNLMSSSDELSHDDSFEVGLTSEIPSDLSRDSGMGSIHVGGDQRPPMSETGSGGVFITTNAENLPVSRFTQPRSPFQVRETENEEQEDERQTRPGNVEGASAQTPFSDGGLVSIDPFDAIITTVSGVNNDIIASQPETPPVGVEAPDSEAVPVQQSEGTQLSQGSSEESTQSPQPSSPPANEGQRPPPQQDETGGRPTLNQAPTNLDVRWTFGDRVPDGGDVVGVAVAVDPDADVLSYTFIGDNAGMFVVDASNGEIRLAEGVSVEPGQSVQLTLLVTDENGLSSTQVVAFRIPGQPTAPDTVAPVITGSGSHSVAENSTSVGGYTADESVTWSLSGADASLFTIDGSGTVSFVTAPDYEAPADAGGNNVYDIVVEATDAESNVTTLGVAVTVTDVLEDPPPTFTSTATPSAVENQTAVVTVTTDESVTFSIVGGADSAAFSINSATGELIFNSAPDFENPTDSDANNSYVVVVQAEDTGGNLVTQVITVSVADAPGNAFADTGTNAIVIPVGNKQPSLPAGDLNFADQSEGTGTDVNFTYSIEGTGDSRITINGSTGAITTVNNSKFTGNDLITMTFRATNDISGEYVLVTITWDMNAGTATVDSISSPMSAMAMAQSLSFEPSTGTAGPDTLTGTSDADVLEGFAGDDSIDGQEGNDILYGGEGDDDIWGGLGADTIMGEAGADDIWGGADADVIYGGGGNDIIAGEGGADTLYGGEGNDIITGGALGDTIVGGVGDDVLSGGSGDDLFLYGMDDGSDSVSGGEGTDTIDMASLGEYGTDWTVALDEGSSVSEEGADYLNLTSESSGTIVLSDGTEIHFDGIEKITW